MNTFETRKVDHILSCKKMTGKVIDAFSFIFQYFNTPVQRLYDGYGV
jgi:hypothetical protein